MAAIIYSPVRKKEDLEGILQLQKRNLPRNLSPVERQREGFVTVDHSYALLEKLNAIEPHVVALQGEKVVGYVLTMTKESRYDIPILFSMFAEFDTVVYKGRTISNYNYMLVGQVCVDVNFRGRGIFDGCYSKYRERYSKGYDIAITEIAHSNQRSLKAHQRIGFEEIHSDTGPDGTHWSVVVWDWNKLH